MKPKQAGNQYALSRQNNPFNAFPLKPKETMEMLKEVEGSSMLESSERKMRSNTRVHDYTDSTSAATKTMRKHKISSRANELISI